MTVRRLDIWHHHDQSADGARRLVSDAFADGNRTGGAGRSQLDKPQVLVDSLVKVRVEPGAINIEALGAVDVCHRQDDELDLPVHGLRATSFVCVGDGTSIASIAATF